MREQPSPLDREYAPSSVARDPAGSVRRYRTRSDLARARLDVREPEPHGPASTERCHLSPAAPPSRTAAGAPALVFVHGGHRQESGIEDACFAAEHTVAHGCAYVAVSYGLAPARTEPDMIRTHVNDAVGLTPDLAHECGPLGMPAPRCAAVLPAVGEHETATYLRRQDAYAACLDALGVPAAARTTTDRDHFDLPLDLADPATPFGRVSLVHPGPQESPREMER